MPGPAALEPEIAAGGDAQERTGQQGGLALVGGVAFVVAGKLEGQVLGGFLFGQQAGHFAFAVQAPGFRLVEQMGFQFPQEQSASARGQPLEAALHLGEVAGECLGHARGPTNPSTMATKRPHSCFFASRKAEPAGRME